MKKLVLVMTMAISLLTMVSFSYASWEVAVTNKCKKEVRVEVKGDHLFWRQVDCTLTVPGGTSKICKMPGGICPSSVKSTLVFNNKTIGDHTFNELFGMGSCDPWNKVVLEEKDGSCIMTEPGELTGTCTHCGITST